MRIHKNKRQRYIRGWVLMGILVMMSACGDALSIADNYASDLLKEDDKQAVMDTIVEEFGAAIMADDVNLVSEALPHQSEALIVDLWKDKDKAAEVYVNEQKTTVHWEEEDPFDHAQLTLSQEGIFQITLELKDGSDTTAQIQTKPIMMDVEIPQLQLFLDGEPIRELPSYLDHEAVLKWRVTDAFFDVRNSRIFDHEEEVPMLWQSYEADWEGELILKEGAHSFKACMMDIAGHEQVWEGAVIVDTKQPVVVIDYEPQRTYRDAFTATFLIQDDNVAVDDSMIALSCDDEPHPAKINWTEKEQGIQGVVTLSEPGRCSLSFHVKDQAGNPAVYKTDSETTSAFQHDYLLDTTPPQLVMDDLASMSNEPQEVTLFLKDDHLDRDGISVTATRDDMPVNVPFTWEKQADGWRGKALFDQDGDYRLRIDALDQAGNSLCDRGQCAPIVHAFTLDQQAPQVNLHHQGDSFYCNDDTQITFSASDRHLTSYQLFILRDHRMMESRNGDHSETLNFMLEQDGEYEIIGRAKDSAGNESTVHDRFIIDRQPPQLQVFLNDVPAHNGQMFISNRDVKLKLSWQDPYMESQQLRVLKNGAEIPVKIKEQGADMILEAVRDREDRYEIEVLLRDYAGNETKAVYPLRIDTYLPSLTFVNDPFQGKARNIAWKPRLQEEDTAFHVNDVILYRDQQLVKDFHWGDTIAMEGKYLLTLSVRDEAMNEATLLPPFAFTIDRTPPTVRILEAKRQAMLQDNHVSIDSELRLYIQDAFSDDVSIHTLLFDGEALEASQRKQDENQAWYYPLHFSRAGEVSLQMDVSDEAGNHTIKTIRFQVSKQLKPSEVKTIDPKQETLPSQPTSGRYPIAVLSAIGISFLFALWVKRVYAAK